MQKPQQAHRGIMAQRRKSESKPADWPANTTLKLLRQQLEELQKFKDKNYREVQHDEDAWQQFTSNVIIHGFGEDSQNLGHFNAGRWAGEHNMMGISDAQAQRNFALRIEKFQATLVASIRELEAVVSTSEANSAPAEIKPGYATPKSIPSTVQSILVLISHSSKDRVLAEALIDLLRSGLGLLANHIRCSSVDGYRLPAGVDTNEQLRTEIKTVKVLIGLLTPNSLSSTYVLFELGARWGAGLFMIPVLAGIRPEEMRGPHGVINALSCETEGQLIQLVEDTGRELKIAPQSAAAYLPHVQAVKALAESTATIPAAQTPTQGQHPTAPAMVQSSCKISVTAEGKPPSQVLKVTATRPIRISRLEYQLSDETCIVGEDVSLKGATVEVPLNHEFLTRLMNTPRPDMNQYDHSGPVKFGITASIGGQTHQYSLPARLENYIAGSTYYRRIVGSKVFYGVIS